MSDLEQAGVTESNFYIREPKPPFQDPWTLILMGMSFVIATGFAAYAFMGWMFGEIENMEQTRKAITVIGAVTLAIGGEFTTPLTVWEVYRKTKTKTISAWDWSALLASVTATLVGLLLGAAGLIRVSESIVETARSANLGFIVGLLSFLNLWPEIVKAYAPLILVFTASADGYAHFIETGLRIGSYDDRHRKWQAKYDRWSEWGAGRVGLAREKVDTVSESAYNEVGLTQWPEEPPVRLDDTPVQGMRASELVENNGHNPPTGRLDSGEVEIEDIEHLHPAVARSILEE